MKVIYFMVTFSILVTICYCNENKIRECNSGEVWSDCQPSCGEKSCDNLKAKCPTYYESKIKCVPDCYCDNGYARQLGKCVPVKKCKTCSRPHEEYGCGDCQTICAEIVHKLTCPIRHIQCEKGCYCKKGFARLNAKTWTDTSVPCVPVKSCPKDSQVPEQP